MTFYVTSLQYKRWPLHKIHKVANQVIGALVITSTELFTVELGEADNEGSWRGACV